MRIPSSNSFSNNDQNLEETTTKEKHIEIQTENGLEKIKELKIQDIIPEPLAVKNIVPSDAQSSTIQKNSDKWKDFYTIITQLEDDIAKNKWMDKNCYEEIDIKYMPDMVNAANIKHPGLNLEFSENPYSLAKSIEGSISEKDSSSRYITNLGPDGIHFAVIDRRVIDGKTSLIIFEPANLNAGVPTILAIRIKQAIDGAKIADCHLALAEMDIQKSISECGIFSLAIAKKLHLKSADLEKLHSDNIKGVFIDPSINNLGYLPPKAIDEYLPAEFYKHTQSRIRLYEYLKTNPESENSIINKKEQTLLERVRDYAVNLNGRQKYFSAHRKRIAEYERLKNDLE